MSLELLEEIAGIFEEKDIDYWVIGGYALDIAVGRLTREHKNTDFLIKIEDSGRASRALEKKGYITSYVHDRIAAEKDGMKAKLIPIEKTDGHYSIPTLNVFAEVPNSLMRPVEGELKGKSYKRLPNELLYLFTRYSPNPSDALIADNLKINKNSLKQIKIVVRRR